MTRNKILFTTLLMGAALVGLVAMQVNWIRHDYKIQEEKFSHQVAGALNNAVRKMETQESVQMIVRNVDDEFLADSLKQFFREPEMPEFPEPPVTVEPFEVDLPEIPEEVQSFSYVTDIDSCGRQLKVISRHSVSGKEMSVHVISPDSEAMKEISISLKEKEVALRRQQKALKSQERAFKIMMENQKAHMEQEKVHRKVKQLSNVFERMAVEYDRRSAMLLERVTPSDLDSVIGSELRNNGVSLPYSIKLQSGASDSIVWQRNPSDGNVAEKTFSAALFPEDIINKNDLVKVGFAGTFSYFISGIWIMLLSSAVFTLAIILIFSYTVYVIFRQKKLSDIKNDFINNMTHELKTPIATIRLASEAMVNPGVIHDPDKVLHYTQIINDENTRMNDHVENILQMAQFDRGDFIRNFQDTNMNEVIAEAVEKMQLQVAQKSGSLVFEPHAENYIIRGDRHFISIVMINLIDNAVKYSNDKPMIRVASENCGNMLIITVADNGIGMTSEQSKKVFEKFYRVTSGNIHTVKGFGLGLSYAKAIVTAHGGTISVISEPGKGSTFEMRFPVAN